MRTFFAAAVLGLCLAPTYLQAAPVAGAALPKASPAASKPAEGEAAAKPSIEEQTQTFVANQQESEASLAALKRQLSDAPRLISESQRELTRLKSSPPVPVKERYGKSELTQLEKLLDERSNQLAEMQKALAEANSLIITSQTRPERAQAEISSNQTRTQQIGIILKSGKDAGKAVTEEQRPLLNAELTALAAQTELRREELAGNSLLQDLGNSRRDLLAERIRRLEQETQDLQLLINDMRRESSEQTVAELSRDAEKATPDSVLAKENDINLKMSDYLLRATDRLNELTQQNLQTRQQLDNLSQADQALEEQISVLKGSLLLSKILYQQRQALPKLHLDKDLANDIGDIRLYQFELNQQRDKLANPQAYVDNLLAEQPAEQVTPELRATLTNLISTRGELLDRLSRELNTLLNESITLQLNQKQLQETSQALRNTLDEQMFWIPSNKPLDLSWLKTAPHLLEKQLQEMPWGAGVRELGEGLVDRPWLFLPLLLTIGALLWKRRYIHARLHEINQDVGHFKRDSQLHTPLALLLTVLLALPVGLGLSLCGYALQMDARGQNATLGAALFEMAQAWMVFYTLYRVLAPGGIAELHFGWDRPQVAFLRGQIRRLGGVVMALVAIVTVAEHQPAALAEDIIGIMVVLSCYTLMTLVLSNLLLAEPMREQTSPFRLLIGVGFTLLPLGFIVAVGFGYYYTSLKLTDRLIITLYLLIVVLLVEATFVRGLAVAARRLAYQRVLAKRQAQTKENAEGEEVAVEEPVLDIEKVNEQSLRLIRLALLGVFITGLYLVWADLISVLAYLDQVNLYQYSSGTGDAATQVPISLLDVLGALIIAGITIALARNLPGLLEVLVLSRLKLAQGSAYATTTLLSYAIAGLGFVSALSTLGVSWDKLQWLVAALSVGIGFGMQAIFANFISGLILLFERPVRIGDLVTIGTVTGTVNRIRIRATHITDSDRKEVIVPNQTFLTSQLINWTLTDTVTRIVLVYNVNRGADLELVRKLLLQAAQENPRVLRDPAPNVQLKTYGASTLEHELKIYVRELGDRGLATDELNRRVDQLFQEHDINVSSVPKMDVTLSRKTEHSVGEESEAAAEQQPARDKTPTPEVR
ncbi:putative small-conductance mechanosensitive channel KefA [Metapseudomonas resinovorans NBRC 106553]|uniref:Putative small-conductance mechanosensitive channel KefA n=1 Tax=Metapseudomonas resinovorans NBRC 106553 TaxID=1245471 RepID=S6BPN6_METRE|nr:putative small-conductance mechanosensitive channel KefA [Pseudomonas resinovorans NBRC 106553]